MGHDPRAATGQYSRRVSRSAFLGPAGGAQQGEIVIIASGVRWARELANATTPEAVEQSKAKARELNQKFDKRKPAVATAGPAPVADRSPSRAAKNLAAIADMKPGAPGNGDLESATCIAVGDFTGGLDRADRAPSRLHRSIIPVGRIQDHPKELRTSFSEA